MKMFSLKTRFFLFGRIILISVLSFFVDLTWAQKMPASASLNWSQPSIYLTDNFQPDALTAILMFHDQNEIEWQIDLRLTLESADRKVIITTGANSYSPESFLRIRPNEPVRLYGDELLRYLNLNTSDVTGSVTKSQLLINNRLPEGFYSLCLEILDHRTRIPISLKVCTQAFLSLIDEPMIINPMSGSFVRNTDVSNVLFQWQLTGGAPPSIRSKIEYQLNIYEITDRYANPLFALNNRKVLKIFESDYSRVTTYLYGPSHIPFERGKRYISQVQARYVNEQGQARDIFKNKGLSQPSWFTYGVNAAQLGRIQLLEPTARSQISTSENIAFSWRAPSNWNPSEAMTYRLVIVPNKSGLASEDTLEYRFPASGINGENYSVTNLRDSLSKYTWYVQAHINENLKIAESEKREFSFIGDFKNFYAGKHEVIISRKEIAGYGRISGSGKVRISEKQFVKVDFKNIKLKETLTSTDGNISKKMILVDGEIVQPLFGIKPITYSPEIKENRMASFYSESLKLNSFGMFIKGRMEWRLPHPAFQKDIPVVKANSDWLGFDEYKINEQIKFSQSFRFELLDPFGFKLSLDSTSSFFVRDEKYSLSLHGSINFPDNISSIKDGRAFVPFHYVTQLDYIENPALGIGGNIEIVKNSGFELIPEKVIIDLSEKKSPIKVGSVPGWKGVYFSTFGFKYNIRVNNDVSLSVAEGSQQYFQVDSANINRAWVGGRGLELNVMENLRGKSHFLKCNLFPSELTNLTIKIHENVISDSRLEGTFKIPMLSESKKFVFKVPFNSAGFNGGYLDSLNNTSYTFNPGVSEQRIEITVKRALLKGGDRVNMMLDLQLPELNVSVKSIKDFVAYGDYRIGFRFANGSVPLAKQIPIVFMNYPMTLKTIGCGSSGGRYAFGLSANIVMNDDVAGVNGPASTNFYSIVENAVLGPPSPLQKEDQKIVAERERLISEIPPDFNPKGPVDFADLSQELKEKLNERSISIQKPEWRLDTTAIKYKFPDEVLGTIEMPIISEDALKKVASDLDLIMEKVLPFVADKAFAVEDFLSKVYKTEAELNAELAEISQFIKTLNEEQKLILEEAKKELTDQFTNEIQKVERQIKDAVQRELDSLTRIVSERIQDLTLVVLEKIDIRSDTLFQELYNELVALSEDEDVVDSRTLIEKIKARAMDKILSKLNEKIKTEEIARKISAKLESAIRDQIKSVIGEKLKVTTDVKVVAREVVSNIHAIVSDAVSMYLDNEETVKELYAFGYNIYRDVLDIQILTKEILKEIQDLRKNAKDIVLRELADLRQAMQDSVRTVANQLINSLTKEVNSKVDELSKPVIVEMQRIVSSVCNDISARLISSSQNDYVDVSVIIRRLTNRVRDETNADLNKRFNEAIANEITSTIAERINIVIVQRLNDEIDYQISKLAEVLVYDRREADNLLKGVISRVPTLAISIVKDMMSPNRVVPVISTIGRNIVTNTLNVNDLSARIKRQLEEELLSAENLKRIIKEIAKDSLKNLLNSYKVYLKDAEILASLIQMDFSDLARKLQDRFSTFFSFDPSNIRINTPILDFVGVVKLFRDDPKWGNAWMGEFRGKLKTDPSYKVLGSFTNGTKDDFRFWTFYLKADSLMIPIIEGVIELYSAEGGVFHHASFTGLGLNKEDYYPNNNTHYGVNVTLLFIDMLTGGTGTIAQLKAGNQFELIRGQEGRGTGLALGGTSENRIGNIGTRPGEPIFSLITSKESFKVNTVTQQITGQYFAGLHSNPILCANGTANFDAGRRRLSFSVGSREDPVRFQLACSFGAHGWLTLKGKQFELEAYLNQNVRFSTPHIPIGSVSFFFLGASAEVWAFADFGFNAGFVARSGISPFGFESKILVEGHSVVGIGYSASVRYFCGFDISWRKVKLRYCTWSTSNQFQVGLWLAGSVDLKLYDGNKSFSGDMRGSCDILGKHIGLSFHIGQTL